jgi:hypothetical protein
MYEKATLRKEIERALAEQGESWADIEATQFDDSDMDTSLLSLRKDPEFTVWTASRVYFPEEVNEDFHVGSVPRHPSEDAIYVSTVDPEEQAKRDADLLWKLRLTGGVWDASDAWAYMYRLLECVKMREYIADRHLNAPDA